MSSTVHVEGISRKTNEDEIKSFFSFCGKIQSISVTPTDDDTQSARVTFEKAAAAKTALLLDNTQLGPKSVHVSSTEKTPDDLGGAQESLDITGASGAKDGDDELDQESKPRARIIAEYLAQGYAISDNIIEKALAIDQQHGVSTKFTQALQNFDSRFHATEKAQAVDEKFGVSDKVVGAWRGLLSYFDKAAEAPTGQKVRQFYEAGNKTVVDVHNEARHLADLKKQHGDDNKVTAEGAHVEKVAGTDKTKCNCAADEGKCGCPEGKCACSGCGKSSDNKAGGASYAAVADPTV